MNLFAELRRRNVFRVAGVYAVAGWLIAQAAGVLENALVMPKWFDTVIVSALLLGFPVALILAWAFEMTPEGMKLTANVPEGTSIAPKTGRRLDYAILGGVALIVALFIGDRMMPEAPSSVVTPRQAGAPQDAGGANNLPHPEELSRSESVSKGAPPAASIAVLPFADMSPGKDQEYFADGMAEEILNVLAKIDGLSVASRTSAFAFRDADDNASDIAATLNVAFLLEGSVRRDGDRLRITAQLIDAVKDRHLWSEAYDRNMADVFAIQEEIAGAIGAALRGKIGGGGETPAPVKTDNLAAYDKYLKARSLLKKRGPDLREAIALFKEVAAEDPDYAPAWSGLVQATEPVIFYFPEAQDPFVLAEYQGLEALAARMAVDRDPGSAEALGGMADHLRDEMRWEEAEAFYRRAFAVDANDVEVLEDFQEFLHRVGRAEEALMEARRGQKIEPLWGLLKDWEAIHLDQLGDREGAVAVSLALLRDAPDFAFSYNQLFTLALADRRYADARNYAEAMPEGRVVSKEAMRQLLDWAERGRSPETAKALPKIALTDWLAMLAAAGADDRVFEILAATDPGVGSMALMRVAGYEALRCDPRLKKEIIRAGLPDYWRESGWPTLFRPAGKNDFECAR